MTSSRLRSILFTALLLLFGLHCMRAFLPSVIWYLSGSLPVEMLALYALGTFALAFISPLLRRWFGETGSLLYTGGGLAFARLALQLSPQASLDLVFSTVGVVFFIWFLPLIHQSGINRREDGSLSTTAIAVPLALMVDVSSRTLLWSYDLVWRRATWALMLTAGLVVLTLALLWMELRTTRPNDTVCEPELGKSLPFAGLGAWLYLVQTLLFNPQALASAAGWPDRPAHLLVNVLAFAGALAGVCVAARGLRRERFWPVLSGIGLVAGLVLLYLKIQPAPLWTAVAALSGSACLGWILPSTSQASPLKPGLWRTALATFLAFLTLLVAVLMNEYDMGWITLLIGVILAILGIGSAFARKPAPVLKVYNRPVFSTVVAAGLIALLAVDLWASNNPPPQPVAPGPGKPLKVMTYNIHQGLNAEIHMDLEEIIRVIAAQNPDVIALNEVNRARANNGYVDTLGLLSHRLNMPYVYGANFADGLYGNAILSRYPILEWENLHYASTTTEVRGLLRVVIDTQPEPVQIFATHLDHIGGPDNARAAQIGEAIQVWGQAPRTLLIGDFNARPEAEELAALYETTLVDVLGVGGQDIFTFWNPPDERIDYIFATPDLPFDSVQVIEERASDHLPVVAEFDL